MAKNENKPSPLRIIIPLIAIGIGALVVLSQMNPSKDKDADQQQQQTAPQAQTPPADSSAQPPAPQPSPPTPADPPTLVVSEPNKAALGSDQIQAGDVIVSVNGTKPKDFQEVLAQAALASVDNPVELVIQRPGSEAPITLALTGKAQDPATPPTPTVGPLDNLRPAFADAGKPMGIGSNDPESEFEVFAEIDPYRASIHQVALTHRYKTVAGKDPYVLLEPIDLNLSDQTDYPTIGTFAASYIWINGKQVKLWEQDPTTQKWNGGWNVVSSTPQSITLSLTITGGPDDARVDVVTITREYRVSPKSHTIELKQRVKNLTDKPLTIRWQQYAQGDVHHVANDYLRGRSLHYVTGYFREEYDPSHFSIYVDDAFIARPDLIADLKNPNEKSDWTSVWPNPDVDDDEPTTLAWLASENRYFVAISSADIDPQLKETAKITPLQAVYPTVITTVYPNAVDDRKMNDEERLVLLEFQSKTLTLAPGTTTNPADLSLDLFVGPREDALFAQAPFAAMHFDKTIRYSLGGACGFCTFQWLANLLLGFLELLHSITFDWGVSIIILVLVVRLLLHPLTKRGQINMMKMGKQMAAIQPELNKLKKKYADDPRQMQQEQMRLFREKGINPAAGALGCLPMFLQMPIWVALYAMLYYAIELRHESAFYGVFQAINNWTFLADLSSADRFIPLGSNDGSMVLDMWLIRFDYSSINVLPILMGITFFINMKYTTPPPMNEQQATQQKIMRIMPLLFPFFLYSAPAGLTLYICASTLAGIVDSRIVRNHVKQLEESGELFKPKPRKPGGFMDRMQKAMEAKQAQMEELKKQQQNNRGPQNYKKRKR